MKKNTKGFTLIELLAVIVILAIIALIATPIVLNLIEKARKGAAQDSAYGVRKTAQYYYQSILVDNPEGLTNAVTFTFASDGKVTIENGVKDEDGNDLPFELDGTKPTGGSVSLSVDGKVSGTVTINGYSCPITESGKIVCSKS